MFFKALITAAAVATMATPALAECLVDYETFELRGVRADDHLEILAEQSGWSQDWYKNNDVIEVRAERFEKYGLPRILTPWELQFWGFLNSVPFVIEAGVSPDNPDLIYGAVNPLDCEFQPYQRAR